jgi:hypothetical protein
MSEENLSKYPKDRHPRDSYGNLQPFYMKVVAFGVLYEHVKTLYDEKGYNQIGFLGYNEVYGYKEIYIPNGYTLAGTPEAPLTGSVSAKTDSNSLSYIPKAERTKEICIRALHAGKDLSYVPTKLRDEELCSLFYKKDKENYKFIPEDIRLKIGI